MTSTSKKIARYLFLYPLLLLIFIELFLQLAAFTLKLTGRDAPEKFLTGNVKVLAVGDSNTYGLYLDEKDSWPSQLQTSWNNSKKDKLEILNFGYPGTNTYRVLDTYQELLREFKPEYVLLMIGVNDYLNPYQGKQQQQLQEKNNPLLTLLNHSRIYKFIGLITDSSYDEAKLDAGQRLHFTPGEDKAKTGIAIHYWKQGRVEGEERAEYIYYGDKKFKLNGHIPGKKPNKELIKVSENIAEIARISKQNNTQLVLLTYPASQWFYKPANKQVRLAAEQNNLPLIDVAAHFKEFCPISLECEDLFFAPHDLHAREKGYRLAAKFIEETFFELINSKPEELAPSE